MAFSLRFGTISVSDGISMGHEGMHYSLVSREIIADSVETVMAAKRLDGSVINDGDVCVAKVTGHDRPGIQKHRLEVQRSRGHQHARQ